ncbi:hypothetical protein GUITHDRAFT_87179 [Guillardia theta CCMP2712]|uniref:RRM domain-containing protein n=2 Tax=Guillardia theta TaxID=55529 RepID=L1J9Q1_GUITC|nr:hypothetical protein GUITHDRAFT_87179 [Guillardia theta CCMP2712]EKX45261.1 hypothetical protein GUITHDRAFT_87179 [Guillardia theta CCMP2712]|eukprot:XP_005832241.1 hypothetical protein GUITHDRAFT_87179 [Guillardia theta CCMP2712]
MQLRSLLDEFIEHDNGVAMGQQAMLGDNYGAVDMKKKPVRKPRRAGGLENGEGTEGDEDRKVFVGNLSWSTNSEQLKNHFDVCGEVVRADVFTERSGRSRGCGIVEFTSPDGAHNAMMMMNNSELDGRSIFVREDRG